MNYHRIKTFIATSGFAGYLPGAPGTWGSIVAILLWYALQLVIEPLFIVGLTVVLFFIGVWVAKDISRYEEEEDPSHIVIDELVGQWIPLWFLPVTPMYILMAFILFRIFDIAKPWPVSMFDRIPGGWGIMLDDIAAGVYALLILEGIQFIL